MSKFNAIVRHYRADQRAAAKQQTLIDATPWLWLEATNARRMETYKQKLRAREGNLHRRGTDQPITEDFVPGRDENALIRNAYICAILTAMIVLLALWATP